MCFEILQIIQKIGEDGGSQRFYMTYTILHHHLQNLLYRFLRQLKRLREDVNFVGCFGNVESI